MLQEWCQKTTLCGISDLWESRTSKYKFCIWLTIMIIVSVMAVYMTVLNIISFAKAPTVTNIEVISSNSMEMPELLVCYQGGFNIVSMKRAGLSDDLIKAFKTGYAKPRADINYSKIGQEYADFVTSKNLTTESFFTEIAGYKCSDVVVERMLAGDMFINHHCNNVTQYVGKAGMPCWVFKSNGQQRWPTPQDGGIRLRLTLPLNDSEISDISKTNVFEMTNSYSLVIEKQVLIATDINVDIPMNYKINILMYLTVLKLLPRSSSEGSCEEDNTFTTSNACYQRCLNRLTVETCNCTYPGMSHPTLDPGLPMCNLFYYKMNCEKSVNDKISSWNCTKLCRPLCVDHQYRLTVSYLPVENTVGNGNKSSSFITVSFSQMQYTQIEEVEAFTWDVAVANVGGQSGLWLGCSIVTIIQAIYYFGLWCCELKHRNNIFENWKKETKK